MALFPADDPVGGKDAAAERPRQQQPRGDAHVAEEVRPDVRGEVAGGGGVLFFSGKKRRERREERDGKKNGSAKRKLGLDSRGKQKQKKG